MLLKVCATCAKQPDRRKCTWEDDFASVASHNARSSSTTLDWSHDGASIPPQTHSVQSRHSRDHSAVLPPGPGSHRPRIDSIEIVAPEIHEPPSAISATPNNPPSYASHSIHAIIGATVDEENAEGFFGTSSAGTFMQVVKRMVEQKLTGGQSVSPDSGRTQTSQTTIPRLVPDNASRQHQNDYALPTRRKADNLMAIYWTFVHTLYPYLDRRQMQEDYEKLWTGNGIISDDRSFMCLLNIIFALSTQLDSSIRAQERSRSSAVFYERARELLDLTERASVRSVVSYLLLGQYFQSTSEPQSCWVFVGLAIRTAQSLGLHLPGTSERVSDPKTREMLRKVWHGCVIMDRIVSMIYGRPCMIGPRTPSFVPFPRPLAEEEYLLLEPPLDNNQDTRVPSVIDFYTYSLKLYEILHDASFNLVSIDIEEHHLAEGIGERYLVRPPSGESHPSVFELEQRISAWEKTIPGYLKFSDGRPAVHPGSIFYRQAVVLHQRQLHLRLLMLRPVLSHFITIEVRDSTSIPLGNLLSYKISLSCASVCVKVAQEAINTVWAHKSDSIHDVGSLSAWWYNILFLYTSATVLIAARLSPTILADVPEESIVSDWCRACELLEEYGDLGTSVRRLATTLRLLFDTVPHQYSRLRQPQEATAENMPYAATANIRSTLSTGTAVSAPLEPTTNLTDVLEQGNFTTGDFTAFDTIFDPNDLSWLMTVPSVPFSS